MLDSDQVHLVQVYSACPDRVYFRLLLKLGLFRIVSDLGILIWVRCIWFRSNFEVRFVNWVILIRAGSDWVRVHTGLGHDWVGVRLGAGRDGSVQNCVTLFQVSGRVVRVRSVFPGPSLGLGFCSSFHTRAALNSLHLLPTILDIRVQDTKTGTGTLHPKVLDKAQQIMPLCPIYYVKICSEIEAPQYHQNK